MHRIVEMDYFRYPKQIFDYRCTGRWIPGQPSERILDEYSREAETGHWTT